MAGINELGKQILIITSKFNRVMRRSYLQTKMAAMFIMRIDNIVIQTLSFFPSIFKFNIQNFMGKSNFSH